MPRSLPGQLHQPLKVAHSSRGSLGLPLRLRPLLPWPWLPENRVPKSQVLWQSEGWEWRSESRSRAAGDRSQCFLLPRES